MRIATQELKHWSRTPATPKLKNGPGRPRNSRRKYRKVGANAKVPRPIVIHSALVFL